LSSEGSACIKNVHGRGYMFVDPPEAVHGVGASTASTSPLPTAKLPTALQPTIGRDDAIDALVSQTLARRFVTIVGPGGIGKTTLAIELGRRLASEFDGDVRFVDLSPLKGPDAVLPTIATALGYSVPSNELLALAGLVANRRLLLIIDCCEHLIDAAANVAAVLFQHAPQIHLIATSREALRADGEEVHFLEPLSLPVEKQDLTASEALTAASVDLFMHYAVSSGYAEELDNDQAQAVAEVCRRLDGNPLAIGLAGSWLITCGFKGLLEGLRGSRVLRWSGRRTLEATLDWSVRLLSDLERRVLARLSALAGPFTMEAAQAQARDVIDDNWMVAQVVEELADKSLISIVPLQDTYVYRISAVTRLYVEMKLAKTGEWGETVTCGLAQERQSFLEEQSGAVCQRDVHLSLTCSQSA
jgi:predicted ATPase